MEQRRSLQAFHLIFGISNGAPEPFRQYADSLDVTARQFILRINCHRKRLDGCQVQLGQTFDVQIGCFDSAQIFSVSDIGQNEDRNRHNEGIEPKDGDGFAHESGGHRADEEGRRRPQVVFKPRLQNVAPARDRNRGCRYAAIDRVAHQRNDSHRQRQFIQLISPVQQSIKTSKQGRRQQ